MKPNHPSLDILRIPTAPRSEHLVSSFVRDFLSARKIPFKIDRFGNLIAKISGLRRGNGIAFSAHLDHPGFQLCSIVKNNVVADFLGGVPPAYFKKGVKVEWFDTDGSATGLAEVIKVLEWQPPKKRILLSMIKGRIAAEGFGMWKLPVFNKPISGTHLVSRVCDDLAGCAAILSMLQDVSKQARRLSGPVYGVFTLREEIGLEGAYEIAKSKFLPKGVPVISIETSKELSNAPQTAGPIVRVGDRSSIFDPELTKKLCDVGATLRERDPKFQFQRKLMDGGTCEATAFLERGYSASGLCIALGNYHNCNPNGRIAAENVAWSDWLGLVRLMTAAAFKQ